MQADEAGTEIPEVEMVAILNGDLLYRDLRSRLAILEMKLRTNTAAPGAKQPAGPDQTKAEFEVTQAQLEKLREQARKMIHQAKVTALKQEKRRLSNELNIAAGQITAFEKEVENKGMMLTLWAAGLSQPKWRRKTISGSRRFFAPLQRSEKC